MMMFYYSRATRNDAHIPWHRQSQEGSQGSWAWGLGKTNPPVLFFRCHKENLPLPSGESLRSQSSNCLSLSKWEVIEIKFPHWLNNEEGFHETLTLFLPRTDLCMFFKSFSIFSSILLLTSTPCTLCISTFFSLREFLYKSFLHCLLLHHAPSLLPVPSLLKENVVQAHNGVSVNHCREGNPATCHSVGKPGGHQQKEKKVRQRKTSTVWYNSHVESKTVKLAERENRWWFPGSRNQRKWGGVGGGAHISSYRMFWGVTCTVVTAVNSDVFCII